MSQKRLAKLAEMLSRGTSGNGTSADTSLGVRRDPRPLSVDSRGIEDSADDDDIHSSDEALDFFDIPEEPPQEKELYADGVDANAPTDDWEWYWYSKIPKASITLIAGEPDVGKTTILMDLTARLITGRPMPGDIISSKTAPINVAYLSSEDDIKKTLIPRLRAAGASNNDINNRVHFVSQVVKVNDVGQKLKRKSNPIEPFSITKHIDQLEYFVKKNDIKVFIIDPLMTFLGGDTSSNDAQEVRMALALLDKVTKDHGVTFILLSHFNKRGAGKSPGDMVSGSKALVAHPRSVLYVYKKHMTTGYTIATHKCNIISNEDKVAFDYDLVSCPENNTVRIQYSASGRVIKDLDSEINPKNHTKTKSELAIDAVHSLLSEHKGKKISRSKIIAHIMTRVGCSNRPVIEALNVLVDSDQILKKEVKSKTGRQTIYWMEE
jgi:hypothetical protein